jgi:cell division protein FtsZ
MDTGEEFSNMTGALKIPLKGEKMDVIELRPKIIVIGIGGAGGNAVNNMIRYHLEGIEFIAANTDAQILAHSLAGKRVQLGLDVTQGLGAGSRPDVGKAAAEETVEEIMQSLKGAHMVFLTAGMGGGTGTGAAPIIAKAAREAGILTVGVVTKPFHFEGAHRMKTAEKGIAELQQHVDTLIVIPNQNLFRIANERTTFTEAFKMADDVLYSGVRGVTDLMIMPGLINLDFADIRSVMQEMGKAMMGTGEATGPNRAIDSAESAISNPLLDDVSMRGARGVLINITGGYDMTLFEVDEAANRIRQEIDADANIIFGSTFDEKMEGTMRVSVVATGIDSESCLAVKTNVETTTVLSETSVEEAESFDEILEIRLDSTNQDSDEFSFSEDEFLPASKPAKKKLSFIDRLLGRKIEEDAPQVVSRKSKNTFSQNQDMSLLNESSGSFEENVDLEIPAFLRRKKPSSDKV